jgi:hypothetical protein
MTDNFALRLMLIVIAVIILFALVAQYNKNKLVDAGSPAPVVTKERFVVPDDTRYAAAVPPTKPAAIDPLYAAQARVDAPPPPPPQFAPNAVAPKGSASNAKDPAPFEALDTEMFRAVDYKPGENERAAAKQNFFPKDRLSTEDLLPKNAANTLWAKVNPAGQGDLQNVNLLDAGWNFGVDTQGQTLRNPNLQIRSEHPNPREAVGPWNQSTIDADGGRRHFELGEA